MTKHVLVNGCSFTFGHGEIQYPETGEYMPPLPFVWPFELEKVLDVKCTNISIGGASNNRIVRTTIESIEKEKPDAVIVQWTSPFRSEWYDEIWETFYSLVPHNVTDDQKRSEGAVDMFGTPCVFIPIPKLKHYGMDSEYYKNLSKASQYYQAYMMNHTEAVIDFCKDVLLLQNYLEKRNIPFMFSGMSNVCMLGRKDGPDFWSMLESLPIPYVAHLRNEIDSTRWTYYAFSKMMGPNIVSHDPWDPHPNNLGHELIARELHKEIIKKELLKDN